MRAKIKHIPKNCKWPLEISTVTGLPKEYYGRERYIVRMKPKKSWRMQEFQRTEKELGWREKLWSILAMEHQDEVEAAKYAYGLSPIDEDANKFAIAISSRNKRDERIHEFAQDVARKAGKNILQLMDSADKDSVRLAASIDVLNRLGFKAPDRIEIDDKRELTDDDKIAVSQVINILNPIKEAEIVE